MGNVYGYIRVSSREQNEARQLDAMEQSKVPRENIFLDKQSGKDFDRPRYREMIDSISDGDVIFVKSIDRLGRNYQEILDQWRFITRKKGADIVVIDMPVLDTRKGKDLMGTFVSDIVLQILSFVSENERKNIRERQREGIEAAKRRKVVFGRPRRNLPPDFNQLLEAYTNRMLTANKAANICGVSRSTFFRWISSKEK